MSDIFGGSKQSSNQSSVSNNQAFPQLQGDLTGGIQQGGRAGSLLGNLLGLGGGQAQTDGFNQFRNSTGYQFGKQQGMDSITGNAATQGLLNSGGTLKALEDTFGQNYADTQYGNYTGLLQNQQNAGLQGAGVLAGAGQQSMSNGSSKGSSTNGAGGFIGKLLTK